MNLLEVFTWEEEEVFSKFSEAISQDPDITDGINYAYWNRNSPVIVQAHIDVVSGGFRGQEWDKGQGKFIKKEDVGPVEILKNRNIITSRVGVLGGDDRAGVASIISINNTCKKKSTPLPSLLLTNGEESGGTGMKVFIKNTGKELFEAVRIIIGLDRRGCSEYVTYINPDDEVRQYIESFGFIRGYGSYSDSKNLSEEHNIPHVNLSVGYYDNHSSKETVHIDEMLLTVKRVCSMLQDPIDKRYGLEEQKVYTIRNYQYKHFNKNLISDKFFSASEKRRKRCEVLKEKHSLPSLCTYYPYLDYLLTDDYIKKGFHVVSTVEGKGKVLEEWDYIFNSIETHKVRDMWVKEFGKEEKIYIKSADQGNGKFYLAVRFIDQNFLIARSATACEFAEARIIKEEIDRISEETAKETSVIIDGGVTVDEFALQNGYCSKWGEGGCGGGCHGDQRNCDEYPVNEVGSMHQTYF